MSLTSISVMPVLGIEKAVAAYLVSSHCSGILPYKETGTQEKLFAFLVVSKDLRSFLLQHTDQYVLMTLQFQSFWDSQSF